MLGEESKHACQRFSFPFTEFLSPVAAMQKHESVSPNGVWRCKDGTSVANYVPLELNRRRAAEQKYMGAELIFQQTDTFLQTGNLTLSNQSAKVD